MSYPEVEAKDIDRVIGWFKHRGIEARIHPRHPSDPSPDLQLWCAGSLIGYCEVKSLGLGPWDWEKAIRREDDLLEFPGNYSGTIDQTKQRLANVVVGAAKQVSYVASGTDLVRVVAVVGHGPDTDWLDVQAVMRGEENRPGLPPYRDAENPNKQIAAARQSIDALVWFGHDQIERLMLNESNSDRHARWVRLFVKP